MSIYSTEIITDEDTNLQIKIRADTSKGIVDILFSWDKTLFGYWDLTVGVSSDEFDLTREDITQYLSIVGGSFNAWRIARGV